MRPSFIRGKNMKRNILTCVICVLLYVMQLPFLGWFIAYALNPDLLDGAMAVIIFSFALGVAVVVLSVISLVAAVKGDGQSFSPLKTTFWVKIALIPFYIINFIIWALFCLASLFPLIIWMAPFVWGISFFSTYLFMLGGGVQNIVCLIKRYCAERQFKYALFAILHFIYVADIVAAALAYFDDKKLIRPESAAATTADSI